MAIETNTEAVVNRREPLSEIWWQGRQWAVTSYGLEARDGRYHIEGRRLTETRNQPKSPQPAPDWPLHMCMKGWVDPADFCTAWLVGLVLHGHGAAFSADVLKQTCDRAIKQDQRAKQISAIIDRNHPLPAGQPFRVWSAPEMCAAVEEAEAELD